MYGKEINITLEDALLSLESLRFMLGGAIRKSSSAKPVYVSRTEEVVVKSDGNGNGILPLPKDHLSGVTLTPKAIDADHPIRLINYGGGKKSDGTPSECAGTRTQIVYNKNDEAASKMSDGCRVKFSNPAAGITEKEPAPGDHIRIFWTEKVDATDSAVEVVISPDTFPGTYKIVGDTFMRSEKTGKDEAKWLAI